MEANRTSIVRSSAHRDRNLARRQTVDMVFRAAFVALAAMSALGLGGCRAVEAIFKVGAWFGAVVVIAIVAVIGGIVALVTRK